MRQVDTEMPGTLPRKGGSTQGEIQSPENVTPISQGGHGPFFKQIRLPYRFFMVVFVMNWHGP